MTSLWKPSIHETIPLLGRRCFSLAYEKNVSRWMSSKRRRKRRCKVQAPIKHVERQEFWRENHTPLWLLIGRIIFLIREKTSFAILIGRRSRLSLAKTHLRMKIYDIAFSWVFLSMYIIKYCIGFFVIHFPLLAILMLGAKLGRGCVQSHWGTV